MSGGEKTPLVRHAQHFWDWKMFLRTHLHVLSCIWQIPEATKFFVSSTQCRADWISAFLCIFFSLSVFFQQLLENILRRANVHSVVQIVTDSSIPVCNNFVCVQFGCSDPDPLLYHFSNAQGKLCNTLLKRGPGLGCWSHWRWENRKCWSLEWPSVTLLPTSFHLSQWLQKTWCKW